MNTDAIRHFYGYHFAENRSLWKSISQLSDEQFVHAIDYSHGSVRDQLVHLIAVDEVWFSELQNITPAEPFALDNVTDRSTIRSYWDAVEQLMQDYLTALDDSTLAAKPIREPDEDRNLIVWQVLLHVVNHGTDHRAQMLRLLKDLGIKTVSQDYVFYVYDHP